MTFRNLFFGVLTPLFFISASVSAQTRILHEDGSPFTLRWCNYDTLVRIVGDPAGGSFSGCGVIEENGEWFFNPRLAQPAQNLLTCTLTYTPLPGGGNPANANIVIDSRFEIVLLVPPNIITCDGSFFVSANIATVGAWTWRWHPSTGLVNPSHHGTAGNTNESRDYYFAGTDNNSNCTYYSPIVHIQYEGVRAEPTLSTRDICIHDTLSMTAWYPDTTYGFLWTSSQGGFGDASQWKTAFSEGGTQSVTLVVNNAYCKDTAVVEVNVLDFDLQLTTGSNVVNRDEIVSLTTSGEAGYTIHSWEPAPLFMDQSAYEQRVAADTSRTYTVRGRSSFGCEDSAKVSVTVNPVVFIPTSFSPNGDGVNDFFRIPNWGDPIEVRQINVYDRWGKLVWTASGAAARTGWDGTDNGTPVQTGVYFYYAEIQTAAGELSAHQGDVTLIR